MANWLLLVNVHMCELIEYGVQREESQHHTRIARQIWEFKAFDKGISMNINDQEGWRIELSFLSYSSSAEEL